MATLKTRLMDQVKHAAVKVGTRGVHFLVEGTTAAAKAVDKLQVLLAEQSEALKNSGQTLQATVEEKVEALKADLPPRAPVSAQAQATAELILEEARAVEERIRQARPARHPLKISVTAEPDVPRSRTQGRKTTPSATAPKRATAPRGGFKAKRGQKHEHGH